MAINNDNDILIIPSTLDLSDQRDNRVIFNCWKNEIQFDSDKAITHRVKDVYLWERFEITGYQLYCLLKQVDIYN